MSTAWGIDVTLSVEPPIIAPGQVAYAVLFDPPDCVEPPEEPGIVFIQGNVITVRRYSSEECHLPSGQSVFHYPIVGLAEGTYTVQLEQCEEIVVNGVPEYTGCWVRQSVPLIVTNAAAQPVPTLGVLSASVLSVLLVAASAAIRMRTR